MKRSIVLMLILGLVFGAMVPAQAGKKKSRTATAEYFAPAYFSWNPTGDHNIGGVSFPTGSGERFVSIEITDNAGMDVSASVGQDPEGDGTVTTTPFCTSTEEAVPIEAGLEVVVFIHVGPCTAPTGPAFATQGTVKATFSKNP
jgi:hypothetical protein